MSADRAELSAIAKRYHNAQTLEEAVEAKRDFIAKCPSIIVPVNGHDERVYETPRQNYTYLALALAKWGVLAETKESPDETH